MNSFQKTISLFLAIITVFLCGCTLPGTTINNGEIPDSTEGQDITMADAADDVFSLNANTKYSFNPLVATNHSNQLVCSLVYDNLVEVDNNFNVIPNIATEWEYNDNATTWSIKIDTTRKFHDGTSLTAKDVAYSLNNVNAASADRFSGRFRAFQGASAAGDDTVKIFLAVGDTCFIKLLNIPIIKAGSFSEKFPTGSGPYSFVLETVEEEPATETKKAKIKQTPIRLEAYAENPEYKDLPVKTIYLKEYQDAEGIISAFEDSLVDVVINDPSSYTNLGYAATNEFHTYSTTNMHYVAFNQQSDFCGNAGMRYALQFAFDRAYLEDLLNGNAVQASVPMYPTCSDYPAEFAKKLNYDLNMCKVILENNGIQDYDDDGWMEYMNAGQKMTLKFILCSDSSAKAGIANRFKEDMASIGVKVEVQELTWTQYYNALTGYVNLSKEEKEDEDFEEIEYDMYYAEIKVRNDFDITEMLRPWDYEDDGLYGTTINFTNSEDTGYETYLYNYLASGDQSRPQTYQQFAEYVLTTTASFVVIGFEKQQLITHRGAVRGVDPNMGNPLYNFKNWEITFANKESDS